MDTYVKKNLRNGIATIEFFHSKSNSLPTEILEKLANSITKLGNFMTYTAELIGSGQSQRAIPEGSSTL